jgi:hypothetical protein
MTAGFGLCEAGCITMSRFEPARRQSRHASRSASQATPTRVRKLDSCRGHSFLKSRFGQVLVKQTAWWWLLELETSEADRSRHI